MLPAPKGASKLRRKRADAEERFARLAPRTAGAGAAQPGSRRPGTASASGPPQRASAHSKLHPAERTQAAGQLRADLQLVQGLVVLQRLRIGVDRPELHALQGARVAR